MLLKGKFHTWGNILSDAASAFVWFATVLSCYFVPDNHKTSTSWAMILSAKLPHVLWGESATINQRNWGWGRRRMMRETRGWRKEKAWVGWRGTEVDDDTAVKYKKRMSNITICVSLRFLPVFPETGGSRWRTVRQPYFLNWFPITHTYYTVWQWCKFSQCKLNYSSTTLK